MVKMFWIEIVRRVGEMNIGRIPTGYELSRGFVGFGRKSTQVESNRIARNTTVLFFHGSTLPSRRISTMSLFKSSESFGWKC